jgi:hypothetical protein
MITRDWASVDHYATLGVARDASADEIAEAFRALVKQLHPDIARGEQPDTERFTQITAAYEVLSDDGRRADYDRIHGQRAITSDSGGEAARSRQVPVAPRRVGFSSWSPRRARAAVGAGVACFVAGVAFSGFIVALNQREVDERATRLPAHATVAQGDPAIRVAYAATQGGPVSIVAISETIDDGDVSDPSRLPAAGGIVEVAFDPAAPTVVVLADAAPLAFSARASAVVVDTSGVAKLVFATSGTDVPAVVAEPRSRRGMPLRDGQRIAIRYSPADPADIRVDHSDSGRNFAFWFVAVKLLVAGPILAAFGMLRLRHHRVASDARSTARSSTAR